jgi:hypothetical protein
VNKKFLYNSILFFFLKRLHIGLLALVEVFYFSQITKATPSLITYLVVFFIIWSAYLQNLTTDRKEDIYNLSFRRKQLQRSFYPFEKLYPLGFGCAIVLSLLVDGWRSFLIVLIALLIFNMYVLPMWPIREDKKWRWIRLKEIFIVKNLTPPLAWALLCIVYPVLSSNSKFYPELWWIFFIFLIMHILGEINFDKPDVVGDKKACIKTIFTVCSERVCKSIYYFLEFLVIAFIFLYISVLVINLQSNPLKNELLVRAIKYLPLILFSTIRIPFFLDLYFYSEPKQLYLDIYILVGCIITWLYCVISYPFNLIMIILWHIFSTIIFTFWEENVKKVCALIE